MSGRFRRFLAEAAIAHRHLIAEHQVGSASRQVDSHQRGFAPLKNTSLATLVAPSPRPYLLRWLGVRRTSLQLRPLHGKTADAAHPSTNSSNPNNIRIRETGVRARVPVGARHGATGMQNEATDRGKYGNARVRPAAGQRSADRTDQQVSARDMRVPAPGRIVLTPWMTRMAR